MASSQYTVYFNRGASSAVTVDLPDGVSEDDLIDALIAAASNGLQSGLCHHCAAGITLGDPELSAIEGSDGGVLYDEDSERAARAARNARRVTVLSAAVAEAVAELSAAGLDPQRQSRAADKVLGDLRRALEG